MELSRSSGDLPDPQQLMMNGSQLWNGSGVGGGGNGVPSSGGAPQNGYSQHPITSLSSSASHGNLRTALAAGKPTSTGGSAGVLATSTPLRKGSDVMEVAQLPASR